MKIQLSGAGFFQSDSLAEARVNHTEPVACPGGVGGQWDGAEHHG